MQEWTVFAGIAALAAFLVSFFTLNEKLMRPLKESIEAAIAAIKENTESISRFSTEIAVLKARLNDTNARLENHRALSSRRLDEIETKICGQAERLVALENREDIHAN